jgi:orotidine-5'-phosphate decarboxylase
MPRIIEAAHSVVLSPDVEPEVYPGLMDQLQGVNGLGGVKLGFELGLGLSLPTAVSMTRDALPGVKVVYDHQKAGNDIDATAVNFARTMERGGVDAAILFPFTGPVVQERWTRELQDRGIEVISGAEMTHPKQAEEDGGYIPRSAFLRMFEKAIELRVTNFVVPGNKPESVERYRKFFDSMLGAGNYDLWGPGFLTQGGDVSQTGAVAGERFHGIFGSGIYKAENPRSVAVELGQKMLALNTQADK